MKFTKKKIDFEKNYYIELEKQRDKEIQEKKQNEDNLLQTQKNMLEKKMKLN